MPIRPRTMPQGTKLSEEWIPAGDLRVDSSYERPLSDERVKRIIADFDPDLLGALLVSRRDDDTTYILDGQHRCEAVVRSWGPKEKLPCLVYHGLTQAEEARIFAGVNRSRTKVRPLDLHRADIAAGVPAAVDLERIVKQNGLVFGTTSNPRSLSAVSAAQQVYRSASPEVLDTTLRVLVESGCAGDESLPAEMLSGVGILLARYGHLLQEARLRKTLNEVIPRRIVSGARHARADYATSRSTTLGAVIAEMLLNRYNKNRRTGRVEWVPLTSQRQYWAPVGTFHDDDETAGDE